MFLQSIHSKTYIVLYYNYILYRLLFLLKSTPCLYYELMHMTFLTTSTDVSVASFILHLPRFLPRFTKLFTKIFTTIYQTFYRTFYGAFYQALGFFRKGFSKHSIFFVRGSVSTLFFVKSKKISSITDVRSHR